MNTSPHSSQILIYGRINGIITELMHMQNSTPCLSVVMPCSNEEGTIRKCVDAVMSNPWVGHLVIVDDGSTEKTRQILEQITSSRVKVIMQEKNGGKGSALRTGLRSATQEYVVVQDADLEYGPSEYLRLLTPLLENKADVVFGSRFKGSDAHRVLNYWHSVGNKFLTQISNMFTNLNLTDMEMCYKCFRGEVIQGIELPENRFGIEPELTGEIASGKTI